MIEGTEIQKLSYDVISLITGFLTVKDINCFAATCKEYQQMFSVKMESQQSNQLIENQSNADILYLSAGIQEKKVILDKTYHLQCLKFNITTKDQGWVKDCQSGSWVEAEFINGTEYISPQVSCDDQTPKKRDPLIYNYQVRDFQRKSKILHRSSFPIESNQVNIYLRSSGDGWQISCKRAEIQKFYTSFITLSSKQLEIFNLNFKKKAQRRMISRR